MRYSTKSRYALRLMMELAARPEGACVSLKEISEHQQISLKYLEQIVTPLARANLVKSMRGSQGGYQLTKLPHEYTAGEILRAVEGTLASVVCLSDPDFECPRQGSCSSRQFWAGLDEVVARYVDGVTLADLCQSPCMTDPA